MRVQRCDFPSTSPRHASTAPAPTASSKSRSSAAFKMSNSGSSERWRPCWRRRRPERSATSASPATRARDIHLKMLETADAHKFTFDTVQMPLNVMDAHFDSFEQKVLPVLVQKNIGVLGMKPMGSDYILKSKTVTPVECLHYAMNLPIASSSPAATRLKILQQALDVGQGIQAAERREVAGLLAKTDKAAQKGEYELYKTSQHFDTTAKHPEYPDKIAGHMELKQTPIAKAEMLIRKPVDEVFEAFVDPALTSRFWFTQGSGRLEAGKEITWTWGMYNFSIPIQVKEIEKNRKILVEWPGYGTPTTVEWTFTSRADGTTFVSIVNQGFTGEGDEIVKQAIGSTEGFTLGARGAQGVSGAQSELESRRGPFP